MSNDVDLDSLTKIFSKKEEEDSFTKEYPFTMYVYASMEDKIKYVYIHVYFFIQEDLALKKKKGNKNLFVSEV